MHDDFERVLAEVVRELAARWRSSPRANLVRGLALARAVGPAVVRKAMTARIEEAAGGRIGVTAGAAVATAAVAGLRRLLGPWSFAVGAAAGAGFLATERRVTPLRRRYAAHLLAARRRWEREHAAWLAATIDREEHHRANAQLVEELCAALEAEPVDERDPA